MQGRRVRAHEGKLKLLPGEYGIDDRGIWMCCTPNGNMGDLNGHRVTEHDDFTITVSPSILVVVYAEGKERELWHGYLEKGIWRSV